MIHWRICKRCNKHFDMDTSKELCPPCRKGRIIKCIGCLKQKEEYVSGLCKVCADVMDKYLEEGGGR